MKNGHYERIQALYDFMRENENSIALSAHIKGKLVSVTWDEVIDLVHETEDLWNALAKAHGKHEARRLSNQARKERVENND
jgi:ATP-dependent exoDNAse (exonuclease V) beta subunit